MALNSSDEKIMALAKPEYLDKIPLMFRSHAAAAACALIARDHPDLYAAFENEPSAAQIEEMRTLVNGVFEERMKKHHVDLNGTDEKIIALVKPEYLDKIPKMFRSHATGATCTLIAREHPELYAAFENEPSAAQVEEMTSLVNGIFEERMKKHHML